VGTLMGAWICEAVMSLPLGGMNQFYITKERKIGVKTEH